MSATSEGDGGPQSSTELQARPAAVGGVALVVLHQVGEVRENDRAVRSAAHWDELEEEAADAFDDEELYVGEDTYVVAARLPAEESGYVASLKALKALLKS